MRSPTSVLAGLLLISLPSAAGDVKIIANLSVKADSISMSDLRSIFLQERKMLKDGTLAVPVLERSGATHEMFLQNYLQRDSQEILTYYDGLAFSGKGSMPKQLSFR
jgi:hypothetical protein